MNASDSAPIRRAVGQDKLARVGSCFSPASPPGARKWLLLFPVARVSARYGVPWGFSLLSDHGEVKRKLVFSIFVTPVAKSIVCVAIPRQGERCVCGMRRSSPGNISTTKLSQVAPVCGCALHSEQGWAQRITTFSSMSSFCDPPPALNMWRRRNGNGHRVEDEVQRAVLRIAYHVFTVAVVQHDERIC